jgi:hypothetical protein
MHNIFYRSWGSDLSFSDVIAMRAEARIANARMTVQNPLRLRWPCCGIVFFGQFDARAFYRFQS